MALTDEQRERASNLRTEYAAIEAYHRALVHYRFIIVGAYFAGVSFLAKAAIEAPPRLSIWACGFAMLITLSAWMLEIRTRVLYRKVALRGEQIEHEFWGHAGKEWYQGLWSSQYKTKPPAEITDVPSMEAHDPAFVSFIGKLPAGIAIHLSHSKALDILYLGCMLAWAKLWLERLGYVVF
jgi:hypothetical protein